MMKVSASKIGEHPFLRTMSPEHVALMAPGAEEVVFEPGQLIFQEGDLANRFYLIEYGKVALETRTPAKGEVIIQSLTTGDAVGWSWLFPPFVWHFQARAQERTGVIAMDGAHLLVACNQNHDLGFELMKRITQVVILRLQATRKQVMEKS